MNTKEIALSECLTIHNKKKTLGIVLTPDHIVDLMVELISINTDTVLLDTCTGTGNFLIKGIKQGARRTIGVELQPHLFEIAKTNLGGNSNLLLGSCFDNTEEIKSYKPTAGIINPPYAQKSEGLKELDFISHLLDCLEPGSLGVAIVPLSCGIKPSTIKEDLLKKHTLEAVCSMPEELFYPVGVVTCLMVFKAHQVHPVDHETWFGFWKDDGYTKTKTKGRCDKDNKWRMVKKDWLYHYLTRLSIPGKSVLRVVGSKDEWCCEAYMETDYSQLTEDDFMQVVKDYVCFEVQNA